MKTRVCCCAFLSLVLCACVSCSKKGIEVKDAGRAKGKTYTVDNSGDAGQFVSMDIDVNDFVHMVYYDKKNKALKYVRQSAAGFAIATVDAGCQHCLFATLRVTGNGEPHIAYYSDATQTFTYAYKKNAEWKKEPIEWGKSTGMGARLLFDDDFKLHAMYYSGDGWLMHAWRVLRKQEPGKRKAAVKKGKDGHKGIPGEETEGIWGSERVERANGSEKVQISFVKQPRGGLAASYLHWSGLTSELHLAVQEKDGKWSIQVVAREDNPGKSSALFFSSAGEPRIVFREARKNRLSIAVPGAGGWKITPLLDEVYNMALVADASGNLLLAFEELAGADPRKGRLCFAVRRSGKWSRFIVDPEKGSGTHLDATLTAASIPMIAYYKERGHSLKLFVGE
ncbi:MAG TPA: hypothetical protein VM425_22465 [Myxococcota bacterium]|nr:hypothetical protein [Myxococcota bacterium]